MDPMAREVDGGVERSDTDETRAPAQEHQHLATLVGRCQEAEEEADQETEMQVGEAVVLLGHGECAEGEEEADEAGERQEGVTESVDEELADEAGERQDGVTESVELADGCRAAPDLVLVHEAEAHVHGVREKNKCQLSIPREKRNFLLILLEPRKSED
ncbi:MAG: hypothetical protein CMH53_05330 [Myxococcales bacterium]|nr:hypothetical protein [Myxococcales bacterium]